MSQKIFMIAGEASGDLYGAQLAKKLLAQRPDIQLSGWGGDQMEAAGVEVLRHISSLSFMGFAEVLQKAISIQKLFKECRHTISTRRYDAIIFIDFPGFNLRMAKWVKGHLQAHTIQYISPKIWAWKESRVHDIRKYIDTLICIFPFEVELYRSHGITAYYCGHPLVAHLDRAREQSLSTKDKKREHLDIALMPGSRKQEIDKILPVMLEFSQFFPEHDFTIGGMSLHGPTYYQSIIDQSGVINIQLSMDENHSLLAQSDIAINTSGTVTLEAALLQTPQIVLYKANPVSYLIGKSILNIKYISLPNILLSQELVPELIQSECHADQIRESMIHIIQNQSIQMTGYQKIREILKNSQNERGVVDLILDRISLI